MLATQGGILGLGAFTGVASARLLGPAGRGELAALTLWPSVLIFLGALGLNQSIVFHTGQRRFSSSEIWTASTALGVVQSLVVIAAGLFILPIALREYSPLVRNLGIVFLLSSPLIILLGYPANLLQGKLALHFYNAIRLTAPCVYLICLGVLWALRATSLSRVVFSQILGLACALVVGLLLLKRAARVHLAWRPQAAVALLNYGWKSQFSNVTTYVNQRLDQLLLSLFVGPRDLGLYVVAVTAATSISFFSQAAAAMVLANGSNSSTKQALEFISRSLRASLLWLLLASVALFLLSPLLIPLVYGGHFRDSVTACQILLPGVIALGLNQVLYDGARSLNHPLLPSYAEGFALLLTGGGLYFLLPRFGFVGAAIASTVAYTGSTILTFALYRFQLRVHPFELFGVARKPRPAVLRPNFASDLGPGGYLGVTEK